MKSNNKILSAINMFEQTNKGRSKSPAKARGGVKDQRFGANSAVAEATPKFGRPSDVKAAQRKNLLPTPDASVEPQSGDKDQEGGNARAFENRTAPCEKLTRVSHERPASGQTLVDSGIKCQQIIVNPSTDAAKENNVEVNGAPYIDATSVQDFTVADELCPKLPPCEVRGIEASEDPTESVLQTRSSQQCLPTFLTRNIPGNRSHSSRYSGNTSSVESLHSQGSCVGLSTSVEVIDVAACAVDSLEPVNAQLPSESTCPNVSASVSVAKQSVDKLEEGQRVNTSFSSSRIEGGLQAAYDTPLIPKPRSVASTEIDVGNLASGLVGDLAIPDVELVAPNTAEQGDCNNNAFDHVESSAMSSELQAAGTPSPLCWGDPNATTHTNALFTPHVPLPVESDTVMLSNGNSPASVSMAFVSRSAVYGPGGTACYLDDCPPQQQLSQRIGSMPEARWPKQRFAGGNWTMSARRANSYPNQLEGRIATAEVSCPAVCAESVSVWQFDNSYLAQTASGQDAEQYVFNDAYANQTVYEDLPWQQQAQITGQTDDSVYASAFNELPWTTLIDHLTPADKLLFLSNLAAERAKHLDEVHSQKRAKTAKKLAASILKYGLVFCVGYFFQAIRRPLQEQMKKRKTASIKGLPNSLQEFMG